MNKNSCNADLKTCSYDRFFSNFANKTRFEIIMILRDNPLSVSEIVEKLNKEQSMISHNLKILENCQIITVEQKGKSRIYSLNKDTVIPILNIIEKHVQEHCCHKKGE